MDQISTPERLSAFSDAVFAIIIIIILVLELQAPEEGVGTQGADGRGSPQIFRNL